MPSGPRRMKVLGVLVVGWRGQGPVGVGLECLSLLLLEVLVKSIRAKKSGYSRRERATPRARIMNDTISVVVAMRPAVSQSGRYGISVPPTALVTISGMTDRNQTPETDERPLLRHALADEPDAKVPSMDSRTLRRTLSHQRAKAVRMAGGFETPWWMMSPVVMLSRDTGMAPRYEVCVRERKVWRAEVGWRIKWEMDREMKKMKRMMVRI